MEMMRTMAPTCRLLPLLMAPTLSASFSFSIFFFQDNCFSSSQDNCFSELLLLTGLSCQSYYSSSPELLLFTIRARASVLSDLNSQSFGLTVCQLRTPARCSAVSELHSNGLSSQSSFFTLISLFSDLLQLSTFLSQKSLISELMPQNSLLLFWNQVILTSFPISYGCTSHCYFSLKKCSSQLGLFLLENCMHVC